MRELRTRGVVTCFLTHRRKLLALRRSWSVNTYPGKWAGVTGSMEGASALEQAWKEIKEETGLGPGDVEYLSAGAALEVVDHGSGFRWVVHPFLFWVPDPGLIRLDWEHSECRWINPGELPELESVPGLEETWEQLVSPERVARAIEDIRSDRLYGSSFLAKKAVSALALAALALALGEESRPSSTTLKEVAQKLARARPAMAAIKNMVGRFIAEAEGSRITFDPHVVERELLQEMEAASVEVARRASELVYEGARVLTCSYSSAVIRTLRAAWESGKRFDVVAVESRRGELSYGERLLDELSTWDISGDLVADVAISESVANADMVLLGADKLLHDGDIINGWPSLELAERACGVIPVYVVAEGFKLDADPAVEEGFDLVPTSLITLVISEASS